MSASHKVIVVGDAILGRNDKIAAMTRRRLADAGVFAINLLSSPGSGKTALLERTLTDCSAKWSMAVVVGDLQTDNDAVRLNRCGSPVVQIVTGEVCHLDAQMTASGIEEIGLDDLDILFIENVGNLVCPAAFDLGEGARVALLSVTEGEDKPLKYPAAFSKASIVLITKVDIAEVLGVDLELMHRHILKVAPRAEIIEVSSRSGEGMQAWYDWLHLHVQFVLGNLEVVVG